MADDNGKVDPRVVRSRKIIPFVTRSQRLAEDIMRIFGIKESIIESFKEGRVLRTNYIHYNKIFQSEPTEQDLEVISDLLEQGQLVYHILLAIDMDGKEIDISSEYPTYVFDNLITKKCYLCVPTNIYEEALHEEGYEGSTRQETIQNYIDQTLFEAQQGVLNAYVTDDSNEKYSFCKIEVTVIRENLVLVT
ncbi:hypothetical protein NYE69_26100 [Paenibacillus sp. FSL R5-0527]|uniref:hypothetical protein n=1 Tax=Paenibacillus sp. FSL R5-0527 TaxID=2975321 RepID=UPI000979FCE4|nr:hypothetical protein BK140_10215 [Paenibacillus macerans]